MKLTIQRGPSRDDGTFGSATLDDGSIYDSLELPWRSNAQGKSCIQIGSYRAVLTFSPHFGVPLWELQGVPGRSEIRIHAGNWGGDVDAGYYSDLLGCISLGRGTSYLQPPEPSFASQRAIINSRMALKDFMDRVGKGPLEVLIIGFDDPTKGN